MPVTAPRDVHVRLLPDHDVRSAGAALAMYFAAPKERRPMVGGMLLSVAVTAFLTGVTEPLEFLFMFLAPLLYLLHALLTGISLFVATLLGIHAGFSFSAGLSTTR